MFPNNHQLSCLDQGIIEKIGHFHENYTFFRGSSHILVKIGDLGENYTFVENRTYKNPAFHVPFASKFPIFTKI